MNSFLLDTSVLSILAPGRPDATPEFRRWIAAQHTSLHISVVSVAEIEQGIAKLQRLGGTRAPQSLSIWLGNIMSDFADRVIPFDVAAATIAGRLADRALAAGFRSSYADLYIAATAEARGLRVLTRNLRHFTPLGVAPIDPIERLPG